MGGRAQTPWQLERNPQPQRDGRREASQRQPPAGFAEELPRAMPIRPCRESICTLRSTAAPTGPRPPHLRPQALPPPAHASITPLFKTPSAPPVCNPPVHELHAQRAARQRQRQPLPAAHPCQRGQLRVALLGNVLGPGCKDRMGGRSGGHVRTCGGCQRGGKESKRGGGVSKGPGHAWAAMPPQQ